MKQSQKKNLRDFFEFSVGALTYGAERLAGLAKKGAGYVKKEWDTHEDDRKELKETLLKYKDAFLRKMDSMGQKNVDFDAIVKNLENLSEEELLKLREILNSVE